MVQRLIRPTLAIDSAIAALTAADVDAATLEDLEAAIEEKLQSKIRKVHTKKIRSFGSGLSVNLLRQWSDHYNWEVTGHLVNIHEHYYDINRADFSSHFCAYARGNAEVKTKILGRHSPQWSQAILDGEKYYRDLSLSIGPWEWITISILTTSPIATKLDSGNAESNPGIPAVFLYP